MNANPYYQPYWLIDDELEHHGVLGMRWGIRRYQPYPKGKHGTFLGQSRDEDIRIKKGTDAYRVQKGSELSEGQTYVSFDRIDHMKYLSIAASGSGNLSVNMMDTDEKENLKDDARSVRMVLTEDIIAPSYQATMDAFIETMGKVKMRDISPKPTPLEKRSDEEFLKNIKRVKIEECRDKAYLNFAKRFMQDTSAKEIFFNLLKQKGYNAIIDDNNAYFGKPGNFDAPMILFDSSSVKVTESKKITKKEAEMFNRLFWNGGDLPIEYKNEQNDWEGWSKQKLKEAFK